MYATDVMFWMTIICCGIMGFIAVRNNNNMRPRF